MVRDTVEKEIIEVLKKQGIDSIPNLEGDLRKIGFNSRCFVNLIVRLEEIYDIEFDDDDLEVSLHTTVDAITSLVENVIEAKDE